MDDQIEGFSSGFRQTTVLVVNGREFQAIVGQSLLAFFFENCIFGTSLNLVMQQERFAFCGMGMCSECEMFDENGMVLRTCQTSVRPKMRLTSRGM